MQAANDHQTARPGKENKTQKTTHASVEKRKNTRRGGDLGEGEGDEVRVEHVVRGQDEETQGESQTPKGVWVSPAPEKEKKKKTTPTTIQTQERERERRDNQHLGIQGSGPKGHQTKQHSNPRDQENQSEYPTSIPKKPNINKHKTSKVSEDLSPQGGGAHGPPCPFGESPQGTVAGGAKHDNIPSTETDTPRGEPSSSPAL